MTTRASWLDIVRAPLGGISTPPLNWVSWTVVLQGLDCLGLPDTNGRKPYIWPVLVRFDDFTKTTPVRVAVTGPDMQDVSVSVPLSEGMHAGDSVQIPATMGTAGNVGNVGTYTFDSNDTVDEAANRIGPNLILVVALFEHHDFEEDVIKAGYTVFQSALQEAVAADLPALLLAIKNNDINAAKIIGNCINNAVNTAVTSVVSNALDLGFAFKTKDEPIDAQPALPWSGVQSSSDFLPVLLQHIVANGAPDTQYQVRGQLQVGTPPSSDLPPFDCASGGPFPVVNLGRLSGSEISEDLVDGDATLDNVSNSKLDLTSRHGGITIAHKVDQHSSVVLTACKGVSVDQKIDQHSHATIVARGDVTIGQKIDQHSTADINSEGAIDIGQKIDQHSVAKLTAGTTVHIGQKIDQHSTAAIFAVGDITIDEGIDQHSTAYITSLNGSINIKQAVDGNSVVTLRAPNGNITIGQKVAGGATVSWSANNFTCPDTSGGTVNALPPFPPLP